MSHASDTINDKHSCSYWYSKQKTERYEPFCTYFVPVCTVFVLWKVNQILCTYFVPFSTTNQGHFSTGTNTFLYIPLFESGADICSLYPFCTNVYHKFGQCRQHDTRLPYFKVCFYSYIIINIVNKRYSQFNIPDMFLLFSTLNFSCS